MSARRPLRGLLVTAVTALGGCADPIPAQVSPCPCAAGFVCCDTGVCAEEGRSCDETSTTLFELARGEWVGYLENYTLPSGSDAIRISVAVREGNPSAAVVFGVGSPLPPAQPSDIAWPAMETSLPLLEAATHTARNLRWEQHRMRFSINPLEPWQPFCSLQPSYPVASAVTGYQCDPDQVHWNSSTECQFASSGEPADCRRATLCDGQLGTCECTATECHARDWIAYDFDLALRGDRGDGSTKLPWNGLTNIRLERK